MKFPLKHTEFIFFILFLTSFIFKGINCFLFLSLILVCGYFYKPNFFKKFNRPSFLIFIGFIVFIPLIANFSLETFLKNAIVVLRGLVLLVSFHFLLLNIESNKLYKKTEKLFPEELKTSIKIAFEIFPEIQNKFKPELKKTSMNSLILIFENIINFANQLADKFYPEQKIYIISGKIHEGKSSFAYKIAKKMKKKGIRVGGIISKSLNESQKRIGYDVIDLSSLTTKKLARVKKEDNPAEICGKFYFDKEGMDFALSALEVKNLAKASVVFVDEVGKLELRERGFYQSINNLIDSKIKTVILVVREEFVKDVQKKFDICIENIINI